MLKSMLSIVFAICTAAVLAAVADTNTVVMAAAKCPQAGSASVVSTSVKANSDIVQGVGAVQSDSDSRIENYKYKCHECFIVNHGYLIAFGIFVSMVILAVIMMLIKMTEWRRRAVSMGMLMLLLGLITFCSFTWVERVICDCELKREIFRSECAGNQLSKSRAVLKAYDQLSGELSRWFALFAVLGTFFGLVLPVGGYLLQIREIEKENEEVNSRVKSLIDKEYDKFSKEITILWRQHSSVAQWMAMQCEKRILRFMRRKVPVNLLGGEGVGLLAWVMIVIQTALATEDTDVVSSRIEFVRQIFERLKENEQYADFVEAVRASPAKQSIKIDLEKCRKILKDKSLYDYLETFSNEFGITMFGEVS